MSHADAIDQAIADINAFSFGPAEKVRAIKALRAAAKFLRKNQANLRDNFARTAISGLADRNELGPGQIAARAYSIADAMMLERRNSRSAMSVEEDEE